MRDVDRRDCPGCDQQPSTIRAPRAASERTFCQRCGLSIEVCHGDRDSIDAWNRMVDAMTSVRLTSAQTDDNAGCLDGGDRDRFLKTTDLPAESTGTA